MSRCIGRLVSTVIALSSTSEMFRADSDENVQASRRSVSSPRQGRRGASATEFALTLPFVVILLFGSIEVGRAVMIQQSLEDAARAGCRVYSVDSSTQEQLEAIVEKALERAGINDYGLQLDPLTKAEVDEPLEPVTVTVSVGYASVSWFPPWFMGDTTLSGQSVLPADL